MIDTALRILDVLAGVMIGLSIVGVVLWVAFVTLTARYPAWVLILAAAFAWAIVRLM